MLGAITGDIIGSRWEFIPTNDYNFPLLSEENSFTDDSICTVAVADALLKHHDMGISMHEWCRRYPTPMGGYGGRFAQWVRSTDYAPYNSLGNGSAMRVSPVGWWFDITDPNLVEYAKLSAACTHNHPEGITGATAVALAIAGCRAMRQQNDGKPITQEMLRETGLAPAIKLVVEAGWPNPLTLDVEEYRNRFDETCRGTMPVALHIMLQSHSFEDAVRRAVSLGADADTLGAIVGSIAEVIWDIPSEIKSAVMQYLPDEMKTVIDRFYNHIQTPA